MTFFEKAIMQEIKAHNAERDGLAEFNKGIKFLSIERYTRSEDFAICFDGNSLVKYLVRCTFKPASKYDNNIVEYQVNVYSNGTIGIYFDGTAWK